MEIELPLTPSRLLRTSTDMLHERGRFSAFREEFAQRILMMDVIDHSGGVPAHRGHIYAARFRLRLASSLPRQWSSFVTNITIYAIIVPQRLARAGQDAPLFKMAAGGDKSVLARSAISPTRGLKCVVLISALHHSSHSDCPLRHLGCSGF